MAQGLREKAEEFKKTGGQLYVTSAQALTHGVVSARSRTTSSTTPSGWPIWSGAARSRPTELLEAAIERVEARNPAVNAVVMKLYDYGRQAIADGLARRAVPRRAVPPEGPHARRSPGCG